MVDLQQRLVALGFDILGDAPATFGPGTRAAIEAFQHTRGLRVDGICGPQTWGRILEAGISLGDRILYRRSPMFRGDDVAQIQQWLSALGFDTGRVDGIFGDLTSAAVGEFQRNCGLRADGVVSAETLRELLRLAGRSRHRELVSDVRERELLRQAPRTMTGRQVALGQLGHFVGVLEALERNLRAAGARVAAVTDPDPSVQARLANEVGATMFVGLRLMPESLGCTTAYFSGYRNESLGGRRLAELIQERVPAALQIPDLGVAGMSVPILRETLMPAVCVEIGPEAQILSGAEQLAGALGAAMGTWAASEWD